VTSELSGVNDLCMGGGGSGACLGDDIITGIPPCDCVCGVECSGLAYAVSRSLPRAETHVDFYFKCLLLSNLYENWNLSTHFTKTSLCKIS
jgi:hypothetical protein